jgi:hypothetical protein
MEYIFGSGEPKIYENWGEYIHVEAKSQRLGTHKRSDGFMILSASLQSLYQKYICPFT